VVSGWSLGVQIPLLRCWVSFYSLDSCQVVLEKLKGGRPQTNTGVIKYVYFTIKVDKDNRNRTGLVERCLRKRPRSGLAPSSCGSPSYKGRGGSPCAANTYHPHYSY
jgi:hypothetical protein